MNTKNVKQKFTKIMVFILVFSMTMSLLTFNTQNIQAASATVIYRSHVQNYGWMDWISGESEEISGTTGQSLRLEALQISLSNVNVPGSIIYKTHCQNLGWNEWCSNGEVSGTIGQSLRVEAVEIKLSGAVENYYDVTYRVHQENYGWSAWMINGETAGITGQSLRLEAIQIKLIPKASTAVNTSSSYSNKVTAFINDNRWKNGASWGASKGPQYSTYGSSGCCAYAADFAKYVFDKSSPRTGTPFYNPNEIRSGDILYVSNSSHWIVVLYRNGEQLTTAEGNWGSKVVISSSLYTINGNTLMRNGTKFRTFKTGYHFQ